VAHQNEVQKLMESLEQENSAMRSKVQSMGDILKNNQRSVGAYISGGQQVLRHAGFADRRPRAQHTRQSRDPGSKPFVKSV
jgi:hypothetical protein